MSLPNLSKPVFATNFLITYRQMVLPGLEVGGLVGDHLRARFQIT